MSTAELKKQPTKRVVLDVETNKYPFFMELVGNFDFIRLEETPVEAAAQETKSERRNVSRFKNLLTADEACKYHQYLQTARQEWDRNI